MIHREQELIYNCRDRQRFVYHYSTASKAIDYILANGTIRLGRYTQTNDPKETNSWQFSAGCRADSPFDLSNYPLDAISGRMNAWLKDRTNVLCCCQDGRLTDNFMNDIMQRGFARPRMWAQYAENHAGVCLIFDRSKLSAAIQRALPKSRPLYEGQVDYRDRPLLSRLDDPTYCVAVDALEELGWDEYCREHVRRNVKRLFFEKNADWQQESEFRWVTFEGDGQHLDIEFGDALCGVMLGANAAEDRIAQIVPGLLAKKLFVQQLQWKGCTPWYRIERSFDEDFDPDRVRREQP